MPTATLTSLALLNASFAEGRDFLGLFVPVVAYSAAQTDGEYAATADIQSYLKAEFHLDFPQHTLATILKRCGREGYLKKQKAAWKVDATRIEELHLIRKRDDLARKQKAIIQSIARFARTSFDLEWSLEYAETQLNLFLADFDLSVVAKAEGSNKTLPAASGVSGDQVVLASYVQTANEEDPSSFSFIEAVAKGHILANLVYHPDLNKLHKHFSSTRFYLDTPLLFQALGWEGPAKEAPARELLELIRQADGRLMCLAHTIEEMRRVLSACARELVKSGAHFSHGSVLEHFVALGYSASDFNLRSMKVERDLERLHVKVDRFQKPQLKGPERQRLRLLLEREVRHRKLEALWRDVQSVEAVTLERDNQRPIPTSLEDAGSVFVSSNGAVVQAARKFNTDSGRPNDVPLAVLDATLTNHIWLKRPQVAPDLPRHRIIAECASALEPDERLWSRLLNEADRLLKRGEISKEDLYLIRSEEARSILVRESRNEPDAFTLGTISSVLEEVKRKLRLDEKLRADKAEQEIKGLRRQLRTERARYAAIGETIDLAGVRVGKWAGRILKGIALIGLMVAVFFALPEGLETDDPADYLIAGVLVLVGIIGALENWKGRIIGSLVGKLENTTERAVRVGGRRLARLAGWIPKDVLKEVPESASKGGRPRPEGPSIS